ncbi:hypothetical protein N1M2_96 [Klebsiella phage N1M2]|uniref:Uncharacterized protein n=1 Tax=Klebsiella phage N1M2 TaxID=2664939 RepID=A0A6B7ZF64_9CAUD|nr:hypothetical protein PQB72_gp096 [Klebsiella phage N1M2]QGH71959.1 hypothetical protein N1M2_96 [Klebsiella phage N1M2]
MIFKSGQSDIEVYFLQEHHLELLNSLGLELSQLPLLPKFPEVSDEDCLEWLKFQRGVEKQLCGFKSTTYDYASDITIGDINRKGVVYKTKYDEVINSDSRINLGHQFYYHIFNGKLFILNSNNTVNSNWFTNVQGNLASSLYQALLSSFSIFELYFRPTKDLKETVSQRNYIDLGYLISKVIS